MSDFFGLDIGMGSIKVVQVDNNKTGMSLEAIGETKTPNYEWVKSNIKNKPIEEVAAAIRLLLADLKIKSRKVVTCLPEDEIISRLIRLPPLKDNEKRDALKFEAETFVPYPLDQVSIDYEVIERDSAGRITVFAIAARNELIQAYIKLFKYSGLELLALESPAVAMKRVLNSSVADVPGIILIDMGGKYSDIVSLNKGNIAFTRSMSVGGESITRAISVNLGLDMASAEEYKKAYGMKEMELEGKIKNAIAPVFSNMAEEIRKAMSLFLEEQGRPVDLLVLSGGGANMPGLAEEITKLLGVEVQVIQPFLHIDTTKLVMPVNLAAEGCRFSLAVGLGLRGFL